MAQDDDSESSLFKNVFCKLMIFALGFLSCAIAAILSHFTYQSVVHKISICTLWTDIPGRLVIFTLCYYGAAICGCLPIPDYLRLESLPEPFVLWKIESWRKLSRNITLPLFSFTFNIFKRRPRNPETVPLLKGAEERFYDCLPREPTEPADIIYPENYRDRPSSRPIRIPKIETPEVSESSDESFMSFDSPLGGHIVPMAKRKSSKPRYLPASVYAPGTPVGPVETTPPRTPEDLSFPEYPRLPWNQLTQSGRIPSPLKGIHRENLQLERKEARKYTRKLLKEERKRKAGIDYKPSESFECEEEADDEVKALLHPVPMGARKKSPRNTRQRTSQSRQHKTQHLKHRKSTTGTSSPKQSEECHGMAASADLADKTENMRGHSRHCDLPPTLQFQLDVVREFFARLGENMQASAQQMEANLDTEVGESRKTHSPEE